MSSVCVYCQNPECGKNGSSRCDVSVRFEEMENIKALNTFLLNEGMQKSTDTKTPTEVNTRVAGSAKTSPSRVEAGTADDAKTFPSGDKTSDSWNCKMCTFENDDLMPRCEMCYTERNADDAKTPSSEDETSTAYVKTPSFEVETSTADVKTPSFADEDARSNRTVEYSFSQGSFHIVYSCTTMSAELAMFIHSNGRHPSEEELRTLFKKFVPLDNQLTMHTSSDQALYGLDTKTLSYDETSIPGMPIEGPARIKSNTDSEWDDTKWKDRLFRFFLGEVKKHVKKHSSVCFVVTGGTASFGGCYINGVYHLIDTHNQNGKGAKYIMSSNPENFRDFFYCFTINPNGAFDVLVFIPN